MSEWKGPDRWAGPAWDLAQRTPNLSYNAFVCAITEAMEQVRDRCDERMHAAYGCPPHCPCGMSVETGENGQ